LSIEQMSSSDRKPSKAADETNAPEADDLKSIKEWWLSGARQTYQQAFITILKTIWTERAIPGEGPVRGIIALGEVEGRPYDISSLAIAIDQPRTNTHRLVEHLHASGAIEKRENGRRVELFLTEKGWRQMKELWDKVDPLIDEFVSNFADKAQRPTLDRKGPKAR
jgi:DNA-binding MarR family transcriptional regulator